MTVGTVALTCFVLSTAMENVTECKWPDCFFCIDYRARRSVGWPGRTLGGHGRGAPANPTAWLCSRALGPERLCPARWLASSFPGPRGTGSCCVQRAGSRARVTSGSQEAHLFQSSTACLSGIGETSAGDIPQAPGWLLSCSKTSTGRKPGPTHSIKTALSVSFQNTGDSWPPCSG